MFNEIVIQTFKAQSLLCVHLTVWCCKNNLYYFFLIHITIKFHVKKLQVCNFNGKVIVSENGVTWK
jgi:hypothetical protein